MQRSHRSLWILAAFGLAPLIAALSPRAAAAEPALAHANGHTYFVTVSGSDDNEGSQVQPWHSIARASAAAAAGDTVLIGPGTYYETLRPQRSGTASASIVYAAMTPGTAVIDGQSNRSAAQMFGTSFVELNGLKMVNGGSVLVDVYGAQGVAVRSSVLDGSAIHGVQFNGASGGTVADSIISNYAQGGVVGAGVEVQGGSIVTIVGNTLTASTGGGAQDGVMVEGGATARVQNNRVYNNANDGISLWHTGADGQANVVENNIIYHNGANGVHLNQADGVVVRNNALQDNSRSWRNQFDINVQLSSDAQVSGNQVAQEQLAGIQVTGSDRAQLVDNLVYSVVGPGIAVGDEAGSPSRGAVQRNNQIIRHQQMLPGVSI